MSEFTLEEGYLDLEDSNIPGFEFDQARSFQNEAFDWYMNGSEKVSILESPVGSGKTSAFASIIKNMDETDTSVITYPTNSLMDQQKEILENKGLSVEVVNSDTLSGSGFDRTRSLNKFFAIQNTYDCDCILTNPDILEAIVQGLFTDPSDKLMRIFDKIDFIVYDEFHFYDIFSTSGILLQSKILLNRAGDAKAMFCSATPREDVYKKVLGNDFDVRVLDSSVNSESGSIFRYETEVVKETGRIIDNKEAICDKLLDLDIDGLFNTVLIFNSASNCNIFYNYMNDEYPELYEESVKDNGYDTYSSGNISEEGDILLTTSKGEVGLDYKVENLFMDVPWNSRKMIQRVGRCGRHSEGKVFVYGLSKAGYDGSTLSYNDFVNKMEEQIDKINFSSERVEELIGMKCANALVRRENSSASTNPNVYDDFDHPKKNRWKYLFSSLKNDELIESGSMFGNKSKKEERLEEFLEDIMEVLDSLRGSTINCKFKYPRGELFEETEYSLLSALRSYSVKRVEDDGTIFLCDDDKDQKVLVKYSGMGQRKKLGDNFSIKEEISHVLDSADLEDGLSSIFSELLDIIPENHLRFSSYVIISGDRYDIEDLEI